MTMNDPMEPMDTIDPARWERFEIDERNRAESTAPCVVIAVDDSTEAVQTARGAVRLLGTSAHYVLVNVGTDTLPWAADTDIWGVVPPSVVMVTPTPATTEAPETARLRPTAQDAAEATASAVAASAGLADAEAVGTTGHDVSEAVCGVANERGADVIVVGRRHRGWLERLFSRSVTDELLKGADCPVLVVP